MTHQQPVRRTERSSNETFVVTPIAEGLRVYSPHDPGTFYVVGGSQRAPDCTCREFRGRGDAAWRCQHILAAWGQLPNGNGHDEDYYADEERRAIQEEGQPAPRRSNGSFSGNGDGTMLLKRSVSPDGRIDSLSAEFSCPVGGLTETEVYRKAERILAIQSDVVSSFLGGNGNHRGGNGKHPWNGQRQPANSGAKSPAVPARLLNVAGMDGKWGRRLFINVDVDGRITRLFGNVQQLADHLVAAGFAEVAEHVGEGMTLNLPCRVVTKPSPDGRYQNVDKVLPPETSRPQRGV